VNSDTYSSRIPLQVSYPSRHVLPMRSSSWADISARTRAGEAGGDLLSCVCEGGRDGCIAPGSGHQESVLEEGRKGEEGGTGERRGWLVDELVTVGESSVRRRDWTNRR
jgi:hypothetical protein